MRFSLLRTMIPIRNSKTVSPFPATLIRAYKKVGTYGTMLRWGNGGGHADLWLKPSWWGKATSNASRQHSLILGPFGLASGIDMNPGAHTQPSEKFKQKRKWCDGVDQCLERRGNPLTLSLTEPLIKRPIPRNPDSRCPPPRVHHLLPAAC